MADFHKELIACAQEAAYTAQQRAVNLTKEIQDAERRKAEAEAALKLAQSAAARLDRFDPVINDERQCPDCWIANEIRSKLKPIPSDTRVDWFRCETCHREFSD